MQHFVDNFSMYDYVAKYRNSDRKKFLVEIVCAIIHAWVFCDLLLRERLYTPSFTNRKQEIDHLTFRTSALVTSKPR